jgi:hypothetical protein
MAQNLTKRQEVALQRIGPVADLFLVIRDTAGQYHPDLQSVGLAVDSSIHDSARHFAVTSLDLHFHDALIKVAPELAEQPFDVIEGILMHEFGHVAAEWLLTGDEVAIDYDDRERQADAVAEEIFGVEIWYDSLDIERALPYGEPEAGWTRPRRDGVR